MAKVALLIGVSDYGPGLTSLPGVQADMAAMQQVLQDPKLGNFDQVKTLVNPDRAEMEAAIAQVLLDQTADLACLYFSGHGVLDRRGGLYLTTAQVSFDPEGALVPTTVIAAPDLRSMLRQGQPQQTAVILDASFRPTLTDSFSSQPAQGTSALDLKRQLGGEWALLSASTSLHTALDQKGTMPSLYTSYLVEGITTGAADLNDDGILTLADAHTYASRRAQQAIPTLAPQLYAEKAATQIVLARVASKDPALRYRREVEACLEQGGISVANRKILELLRERLTLSSSEAQAIETSVLQPYQTYRHKLQEYEHRLAELIAQGNSMTQQSRRRLQQIQANLGLRDQDIAPLEAETFRQTQVLQSLNQVVRGIKAQPIPAPPAAASPQERSAPAVLTLSRPDPPATSQTPTARATNFDFPDFSSTFDWRLGLGIGVGAVLTLAGVFYGLPRLTSSQPESAPVQLETELLPRSPSPGLPTHASPLKPETGVPPKVTAPATTPVQRAAPPQPASSSPVIQFQPPTGATPPQFDQPVESVAPAPAQASPEPAPPQPAPPTPAQAPPVEASPSPVKVAPEPEPAPSSIPLPDSWPEPPPTSAPNSSL